MEHGSERSNIRDSEKSEEMTTPGSWWWLTVERKMESLMSRRVPGQAMIQVVKGSAATIYFWGQHQLIPKQNRRRSAGA